MKRLFLTLFALAGLLVFAPSNSHAQGSDPYGEMIELELEATSVMESTTRYP